MTEREYGILAAALKAALTVTEGTPERGGVVKTIYALVNTLGEDDPRFDGHRFMRAAGLTDRERYGN